MKSYDVNIQMKALCLYLHMVLFVCEIWKFGNLVEICFWPNLAVKGLKIIFFQGYTFLWCSRRICFRLNSTLGKAFFTRPVRTVSRRSNTFWSSGQSVKCRCTTLVRNSIISMRSMECPAHISNSSRRAKTRISSSFVYNSFFFCSIICCFESAEEKSFQLQCRSRRNEFKAMTEGLFWGGGGWMGRRRMSWEGLILVLRYTVLFLRGTGGGWFNLRVFCMVTSWGVKKFMNY